MLILVSLPKETIDPSIINLITAKLHISRYNNADKSSTFNFNRGASSIVACECRLFLHSISYVFRLISGKFVIILAFCFAFILNHKW